MIIELHPAAENELGEAALWYQRRVAGLGDDLLDEVDCWLNVISENPQIWRRWPGAPSLDPSIRRAVLRRFPFAIAYQSLTDRIRVLAVAHTSRRPFYWASRT